MTTVVEALASVESRIPAKASYDPHRELRQAFTEAKTVILSALQATEAHVVATESAINVVREKGRRIAELESDLAATLQQITGLNAQLSDALRDRDALRVALDEEWRKEKWEPAEQVSMTSTEKPKSQLNWAAPVVGE